jgi:hypothetical protein
MADNLQVPILNFAPPVVVPPVVEKRVIIATTRDIDDDDTAVLKDYGKVLSYNHDLHNNLDCDAFEWSYLIIDLRNSEDRYYYMKTIQPKKDKYSVVLYHYGFENEELMEVDNDFNKFPAKQAIQKDFNNLLLLKRIVKPRWYASLFKCILKSYQKVKG